MPGDGGINDDRSLSCRKCVRISPLNPKPVAGPKVGESTGLSGEARWRESDVSGVSWSTDGDDVSSEAFDCDRPSVTVGGAWSLKSNSCASLRSAGCTSTGPRRGG